MTMMPWMPLAAKVLFVALAAYAAYLSARIRWTRPKEECVSRATLDRLQRKP